MTTAKPRSRLEGRVWQALDNVMDPELDEPITELGFVEAVAVSEEGIASVQFRLPTYWCAPNFAFLMAEGIRNEALSVPGVGEVRINLCDHLLAEEMNTGLSQGRGFAEIFGAVSGGGNLEEVRETFERKAFKRRQEVLLRALIAAGSDAKAIATMTLGAFDRLDFADPDARHQKPRYRQLLTKRGLAGRPQDLAFRTFDANPLPQDALDDYLDELRRVRINMEFNGSLCRGLAKTRYKEVDLSRDEPTLIDFMLDRVPPPEPQPDRSAP